MFQTGGVYQRGGVYVNSTRTIREEVFNILKTKPMEYLGGSSSYGTVFSIDFDRSEITPFINLELNKVVRSFIIKILIVYDNKYSSIRRYKLLRSEFPFIKPGNRDRNEKQKDSIENFIKESKIQQYVWAKSVSNGRPAICPPIIDSILIDSTNIGDLDENNIIKLFYRKLRTNEKIGIIVMPMVEGKPLPYYAWYHSISNSPSLNNSVLSSLFAQIIRLFIDIYIIHLDLNDGNTLVYRHPRLMSYEPILIDFGIVSILNDNKDDQYFTKEYKSQLMLFINYCKNKFYQNLKNDEKISLITEIIDKIVNLEAKIFREVYLITDPNQRPFKTFLSRMINENIKTVYLSTYTKLKDLMTENPTIRPMHEIESYISQQKMYDYNYPQIQQEPAVEVTEIAPEPIPLPPPEKEPIIEPIIIEPTQPLAPEPTPVPTTPKE